VLPEENAVRFTVRDTGLGIAPENQQIIFEEFGQVENRLQKRVKGTGLGLPLCRKLALLLGGRIELESEVGKGSVFAVVIPLRYGPATPEAPGAAETGEDQRTIPLLIIEDNLQTQMLYEKYLANTDFRPLLVRSIWEAERALETTLPAAVLLDIHLGSEDSWSWLSRLKADPERNRIPVLVLTEIDDRDKGYALGADAYFIKPVFREELMTMLHKLTAQRQPKTGLVSS
jgi:CheY-like chemotaxis protein